MRPRKWVIIAVLIAAVLAAAAYQGLRFLEKRYDVRTILINRISPVIGGRFYVGEVRIGFLSVLLKNVRIAVPLNSLELTIKDIKVGISLSKLFHTRGAFERSISKIIFIEPRLGIIIGPAGPAGTSAASNAPALSLDDFPVSSIMIKNGTAFLRGTDGYEIIFGEELNGSLTTAVEGLLYDLRGKLASKKRNFSLAGLIGRDSAGNRLSVRFDHAELARPLRFKAGSVERGTIDGTLEFLFAKAGRNPPFEASGWVRVDDATFAPAGGGPPLEKGGFLLAARGTQFTLDSLRVRWNGIPCTAQGSWALVDSVGGSVRLTADSIDVSRLLPDVPASVLSSSTAGWLRAEFRHAIGPHGTTLLLRGGGAELLGAPLTALTAAVALSGDTVIVDSVAVATQTMHVVARGSVTNGPDPRCALRCVISADSLPSFPAVQGKFSGRLSVQGRLAAPDIDATCTGANMVVSGFALGTQRFTLSHSENRLHFQLVPSDKNTILLSGFIDSAFTSGARLAATARAGSPALKAMLSQIPGLDVGLFDSLKLEAQVTGRLPLWNARTTVTFKTPMIAGSAALELAYTDTAWKSLGWRLTSLQLVAGDSAITARATGTLWPTVIDIDSAELGGVITAAGSVALDKAQAVSLDVRCAPVAVGSINRWFFKKDLPVDSGTVSGTSRISGTFSAINATSELRLRNCSAAGISGLETDMVIMVRGDTIAARPFVLRKGGEVILSVDSLSNRNGITLGASINGIDINTFAAVSTENEHQLRGTISGTLLSADSGFPVTATVSARGLCYDTFSIDSVALLAELTPAGVSVIELKAADGARTHAVATGFLPWPLIANDPTDLDTFNLALHATGDLLATLARYYDSPVGGTGRGEVDLHARGTAENWRFDRLLVRIPVGVLTVTPFVRNDITNFSFNAALSDSGRVNTVVQGRIKRRLITIRSTHAIPRGYTSFIAGPLDFGALLVETPEGPVELHLAGFHDLGEVAEIEFGPRSPFPAFALSGPIDKLKLSGTWIIRSTEFTYPFLPTHELNWPFDPFPYISWELDLKPGNRNVMYYWDLTGKRKRIMRFVEGYLDPSTKLTILGRDLDKTFRIVGSMRSYKGAVYFGKVFDRNFDVGLEFDPQKPDPRGGFDNLPVIWGSAEAFSDSSRMDRVKLTLRLTDPATGGMSERGRIAMIPAKGARRAMGDSIPNFVFGLSSNIEQVAGESEREFYQETGLQFSTIEGAGEFVGGLGEQYLHRYFLQRLEKQVAQRLGLDVISIETSIASNYFNKFYNRQFSELYTQWDKLALANVGITVGRYFFHDYVFVKARGELVPLDTLLRPEYSVGLEFQPARFLLMDFNYGFYQGDTSLVINPRMNVQLRLPITRLRKLLNF